jgi:hypothetical protein
MNIFINFNAEVEKEIFSNWQLEMKVYMQLVLTMRLRVINFTTLKNITAESITLPNHSIYVSTFGFLLMT